MVEDQNFLKGLKSYIINLRFMDDLAENFWPLFAAAKIIRDYDKAGKKFYVK